MVRSLLPRHPLRLLGLFVALCLGAAQAHADAVDILNRFVQTVQSGRAVFTQTVVPPERTSNPDAAPAAPPRTSTGRFEFLRPDRFRFEYEKPYEQTIVADGRRVWLYDPDLRQASVRAIGDALGSTPAALLTGGDLARDFELAAQSERDGLQWVRATPRAREGAFQWIDVGFRGEQLAAVEILDGFSQRTILRFDDFEANAELKADAFSFTPPAGVDVIEQ